MFYKPETKKLKQFLTCFNSRWKKVTLNIKCFIYDPTWTHWYEPFIQTEVVQRAISSRWDIKGTVRSFLNLCFVQWMSELTHSEQLFILTYLTLFVVLFVLFLGGGLILFWGATVWKSFGTLGVIYKIKSGILWHDLLCGLDMVPEPPADSLHFTLFTTFVSTLHSAPDKLSSATTMLKYNWLLVLCES